MASRAETKDTKTGRLEDRAPGPLVPPRAAVTRSRASSPGPRDRARAFPVRSPDVPFGPVAPS